MSIIEAKYHTVKEVAATLGVSKKTIFRYLQSGQLPAKKIGQWRITTHDFKAWLNKYQPQQNKIKLIKPQFRTMAKLPLYLSPVAAGFPSPAEDFIEEQLDLNKYLIKNQPATFLVRVQGSSMIEAGIFDKDILVVDKSVEPDNGKVVIAVVDGELTVKRLKKEKGKLFLMPANVNYKPIEVKSYNDFTIWGVVTNVIHKL